MPAPKCAASLWIDKPGYMSEKGRKEVAKWLRMHADDLVKYGKKYTDTGRFVGKYMFARGK